MQITKTLETAKSFQIFNANYSYSRARVLLGAEFVVAFSSRSCSLAKAELLQEGIFFLIHLFAQAVLVMKSEKSKKLSPLLLYQFLKLKPRWS